MLDKKPSSAITYSLYGGAIAGCNGAVILISINFHASLMVALASTWRKMEIGICMEFSAFPEICKYFRAYWCHNVSILDSWIKNIERLYKAQRGIWWDTQQKVVFNPASLKLGSLLTFLQWDLIVVLWMGHYTPSTQF